MQEMFQLIQVLDTVLKLENEIGLFVTGLRLNIAGLKINQIGTIITRLLMRKLT